MPCFAVPCSQSYNRTSVYLSGDSSVRAFPGNIANRKPAQESAGFLERDCGLPQARRNYSPALGEARGDARSPAASRQDWLCLRFHFGARCLAAKPQGASRGRTRRASCGSSREEERRKDKTDCRCASQACLRRRRWNSERERVWGERGCAAKQPEDLHDAGSRHARSRIGRWTALAFAASAASHGKGHHRSRRLRQFHGGCRFRWNVARRALRAIAAVTVSESRIRGGNPADVANDGTTRECQAHAANHARSLSKDQQYGSTRRFDCFDWRPIRFNREGRELCEWRLAGEHGGSGEQQKPCSRCAEHNRFGNAQETRRVLEYGAEIQYPSRTSHDTISGGIASLQSGC